MNVLNIKMRPSDEIKNTAVIIDGNVVNLKKGKDGLYGCRYETESDSAEISVCNINEINGKLWFLYSVLFFIVSLLGIFDAHYDRKCYRLRFKTVLNLSGENTFTIKFNRFAEGKQALQYSFDGAETEELENEFYIDLAAKKRLKTMLITKLLVWLAVIIIAVVVIVIKVING